MILFTILIKTIFCSSELNADVHNCRFGCEQKLWTQHKPLSDIGHADHWTVHPHLMKEPHTVLLLYTLFSSQSRMAMAAETAEEAPMPHPNV